MTRHENHVSLLLHRMRGWAGLGRHRHRHRGWRLNQEAKVGFIKARPRRQEKTRGNLYRLAEWPVFEVKSRQMTHENGRKFGAGLITRALPAMAGFAVAAGVELRAATPPAAVGSRSGQRDRGAAVREAHGRGGDPVRECQSGTFRSSLPDACGRSRPASAGGHAPEPRRRYLHGRHRCRRVAGFLCHEPVRRRETVTGISGISNSRMLPPKRDWRLISGAPGLRCQT